MKSDGRECELVIFDCDGVLVDSEILSARAYAELFADLGVPLPLGVMEGCFGLKQADIFARIEAAVGRVIGPDDRAQHWPRTRALFASELKPTPGLVPFLQRLRLAHCVVSSSHEERIRFSLEITGLQAYFDDAIFSSQLVERGKPAPDIFLHAAEAMGARPERCVVVEDFDPRRRGSGRGGNDGDRLPRRDAPRSLSREEADARRRDASRRELERRRAMAGERRLAPPNESRL